MKFPVYNYSSLRGSALERLSKEIGKHGGLKDALGFSGGSVVEVVTQDEFTHDVIISHENVFLVYDTT